MAVNLLVKDEIRSKFRIRRSWEDRIFGKEKQSEVNDEDKEPPAAGEARNWAELPCDILLLIFKKIAAAGILRSAQFVCRPWRKVSYEPALWRCIDMRRRRFSDNVVSLAMVAVDRSQGCVEEFYWALSPIMTILCYISERATQLRCLHLISVRIHDKPWFGIFINFPRLEELEVSHCSISGNLIEQIAQACPLLKIFRHDERAHDYKFESVPDMNDDIEALTIAKHMQQLRRLQLFGNSLTNTGLLAILNSCPYLEHLDIRRCFNIDLDENLKNKCAGIKVLRLPNDSTEDYEYHSIIARLNAFDAECDLDLRYESMDFETYD